MALNFSSTKEQSALHGVKTLVHGKAGYGKTTLCATAPEPIILSAESGLLSLREHDIPVIVIKNFNEFDEAYTFLTTSDHAKHFKTVCIDSLSEIGEICLSAEKVTAGKDPRRAYGEYQDKMLKMIRKYRDMPDKHVYFSAKQGSVKDEITGVTTYGPDMPGRTVGPQLPYFFDIVMSLEVGKTPEGVEFRYLRTKANLTHEAKDRSGALDEFEEPNLAKVFEKILNTQGGK
jgi:hypothetical protein